MTRILIACAMLCACSPEVPEESTTVAVVHACISASCRVDTTDGRRVTVLNAVAAGDQIARHHGDTYWYLVR